MGDRIYSVVVYNMGMKDPLPKAFSYKTAYSLEYREYVSVRVDSYIDGKATYIVHDCDGLFLGVMDEDELTDYCL